ncbi:hydrophobic surface binding protein A-domain-containing protein [Biscogniauxia mediterranea]|nr:hydrophobic surface binding protein A-domain-containing protein [Biscogniauxia mediterranea]
MKSSFILSASALALGAFADPLAAQGPTKVQRDVATVTSVIAELSSAITQLDTAVKAFAGDASAVQKDAESLLSSLETGVSQIASAAGDLSLTDALGLQDDVAALGSASTALLRDLAAKKDAFAAAGLCAQTEAIVGSIGTTAKSLVGGVIAALPQPVQDLAQAQTGQLLDILARGIAAFAPDSCQDGASATASVSVSVPAATSAAVVGASSAVAARSSTCSEEQPVAGSATTPSAPASTTSTTTTTLVRTSSSFPPVAASTSTGVVPTGSFVVPTPSSSLFPVPTAAAPAKAGPVGVVVAGLAVALLL